MAIFKQPKKAKAVKEEKKSAEIVETKTPGGKIIRAGVLRGLLRKPYFTEKATAMHDKDKYVFLVEDSANKPMVREEINHRYGVKVKDVNIIRHRGKKKMWRNKAGVRSAYKKAIVTLVKGQKIDIS
jgi:large subunit ribosomal protein L23